MEVELEDIDQDVHAESKRIRDGKTDDVDVIISFSI